jgi:hypothetical protein
MRTWEYIWGAFRSRPLSTTLSTSGGYSNQPIIALLDRQHGYIAILDHGLHAARTALVFDRLQRGHVADLNQLDDLGELATE